MNLETTLGSEQELVGVNGGRVRRGEPSVGGTSAAIDSIGAYELPEFQQIYVHATDEETLEVQLILLGVSCAGCCASIERKLGKVVGVIEAEVNFSQHRARVLWDPHRVTLTQIIESVRAIGYDATPFDPRVQADSLLRERRTYIRQVAVAGVVGMQIMMLSVALYAGQWSGMSAELVQLLRGVSLGLTTVMLAYPALPFFRGAWRSLRSFNLGMDVPVSLGLLIAYGASVHGTLHDSEVYFESVAMFVFLLLLARFAQSAARRRSLLGCEVMTNTMPATANLVTGDGDRVQRVASTRLRPGERIRVLPGETFPTDGRILSGVTRVNEAVLTGESEPLVRGPHDKILGGSINDGDPVDMSVERAAADSYVAKLLKFANQAATQKPQIAQLADRVAGMFVVGVLILAGAVALFWWHFEPQRWLPITLAVLVASCPCALSLATPTALVASLGGLARRGVLVLNANAIEALSQAKEFVFDKTGTLTSGRHELVSVTLGDGVESDWATRVAASLECHSEHCIARAFARATEGERLPSAGDVKAFAGEGVSGVVDGRHYWLGNAEFVSRFTRQSAENMPADAASTLVFLADRERIVAIFHLADQLRAHAAGLIGGLRQHGARVSVLSGDRTQTVRALAEAVGVDTWRAEAKPQDKIAYVNSLEEAGRRVVMVGDGLNDAPVSASASVSIAMGEGVEATQAHADAVLVSNDLHDLERAILFARETRAVVIQNLSWAFLYNLLALPAAAAGWVPPWLAALGMSTSSLIVVGNSLRLSRRR